MTAPIVVIRPEPGFATTMAAGRAMGLTMAGAPLFVVHGVDWDSAGPAGYDGVLLGSANAVRHAGCGLERWRGKAAYVVGEATAAAARDAGLVVARSGTGGLQTLLDALPAKPLHLLRLAGADHVPLNLPEQITFDTRIVYESSPARMPQSLAQVLMPGAIVLLHSAAAALHLAAECTHHAIATDRIRIAALGPRIADAARDGRAHWQRIVHANQPTDGALLALARQMCETNGEETHG